MNLHFVFVYMCMSCSYDGGFVFVCVFWFHMRVFSLCMHVYVCVVLQGMCLRMQVGGCVVYV